MKRLLTQKSLAILFLLISVAFLLPGSSTLITAASFPSFPPTKTDYCYVPPFVTRSLPPAVMLIVQRDEKLYQPAYNDYTDLDGDGELETTYKHSIQYYGYFDPYKCYSYASGQFTPFSNTTDKYCTGSAAGKWSGNFLNWATMTRMDVMRKVLYGGYRYDDPANASGAVLERAFLPQDSHSFAKVYTGSDKNKLTPYNDASLTFCNTTIGGDGNPPSVRIARGDEGGGVVGWPNWANVERWECAYHEEHGGAGATAARRPDRNTQKIADLTVRVAVAQPALLGTERVKQYPSGNYKPIGLLQQYGEGGGDKFCSKSLKTCASSSDCGSGDGNCVYKSPMYFGLITGSFQKNKSGGLLRSKITDIADDTSGDINRNTGAFTGANGGIIKTINNLRIIRYDWSEGYYNSTDSCLWGLASFSDGNCSNWGNPLGEMFYEAIRYFAGKTDPTSAYYFLGNDYINTLKKETWNSQIDPYSYMPYCSKAFVLILNDVTPSYDSDQLPGGRWGSFGAADFSGVNSSGDSVTLDVSTETKAIGDKEGYTGNTYFIGQSGTSTLQAGINQCTAKTVSDLSLVRGLCPGGPGNEGSYYLAGLAWYAKRLDLRPSLGSSASKQNVTTFVVALDSGLPEIKVGPFSLQPACFNNDSGIKKPCRLVNFRQISKTATTAKYAFSWEDSLQGGDTDEDADGTIEYTYNSVANTLTVTTQVLYSSTPNDLQIGYAISGSNDDGLYLETSNGRQMTFSYPTCTNFGFNCTAHNGSTISPCSTCRTNVHSAGTSAATYMKNPLWLAAKYGGYNSDSATEPAPGADNYWDQRINATGEIGADGIPDSYFEARNPLELEAQLIRALNEMLDRSNSGTTVASMPPNTSRESFVIAQSFFYQQKTTTNGMLKWIGYLRLLWADSLGNLHANKNTAGETAILKYFDMIGDWIVAFVTNSSGVSEGKYYTDTNGDGVPDSCSSTTESLDDVPGAFEAGDILKAKSPDDRRLYFWYDAGTIGTVDTGEFVRFVKDDTTQANHLAPMWSYGSSDICDTACAKTVMKYILGYDRPNGKNYTLRQVVSTGSDLSNTWKLGDIIYSSPRIWPDRAVNGYIERYGDTTYRTFIENTIASQTPLAIAGANDGFVHAFRIGKYSQIDPPTTPGKTIGRLDAAASAPSGLTNLGDEVWAYMPRNVIPYIRWYCDRESCHIPLVDSTVQIVDASIGGAATGTKSGTTWRRLLIGTMGFGGSAVQVGTSTATKVTFSSSIFVLDVTDALNPALLWEKTMPDNSLTSGTPAIVRLGDRDKNGSWYLVIGSGPQRITTASVGYVSTPKIQIFDLKTGQDMASGGKSIDASITDVAVGDILAADLDGGTNDYQVDDLYFGTYGGTNTNPKGNLYRLRIRNGSSYYTNPADWQVERVVTVNDRIMAAPAVTSDEYNNRWLYFGTGMFITQEDVPLTTGYLYGFKDKTACWTGSAGACAAYTNFYETSGISFTNATVTQVTCNCEGGVFLSSADCAPPGTCPSCPGGATAYVSKVTGATLDGLTCTGGSVEEAGIICVENLLKTYDGWKWMDKTVPSPYRQGKFYSTPTVVGGVVGAAYFVPDSDVCSLGGSTWLAALHYTTGTPSFNPTVLADVFGSGTGVTIHAVSMVGQGAPPMGGGTVIFGGGDAFTLFLQLEKRAKIAPTVPIEWNRFIQWVTR